MKYTLCIHGGAGVINKKDLDEAEKKAIISALQKSLHEGEQILKNGGTAVEAACKAVSVLEDSPCFNAGKGAVFSRSGKHFLEASVMDGATLKAGAVANCKTVKNPVRLAQLLMERDDIVFLSGEGADKMAVNNGLIEVPNTWFDTEFRKKQWEMAKKLAGDQTFLDHTNFKKGTVGAVAIDREGNLAAATSTGGMTNKIDGRIGDTAMIGSGTYANNDTCAVSCTGIGEMFIRATVASKVADMMRYGNIPFTEASQRAIDDQASLGGDGGIIAIDKEGNYTMPYNSEGMYRGVVTPDTTAVYIWDQEEIC